jgi:hypothetical protein
MVLTTERSGVQPGPVTADLDWTELGLAVRILRPSAVVLRRKRETKLP